VPSIVDPHVRHRWLVPVAALAGTAVLATAAAVVGDRVVSGSASAPHLATVPTSVLTGAGYSLAPALPPLYCGVAEAAADRGWAPGGAAGCPISRSAAVSAAPTAAQEALLARVTSSRSSVVGKDRLVWLVVFRPSVQLMPMIRCAAPANRPPCPPASAPVLTGRSVVFVDAYTGRLLTFLSVTGAAAGAPPSRFVPAPTFAPAPVKPAPTPTVAVATG
jgi:hypothetical protein